MGCCISKRIQDIEISQTAALNNAIIITNAKYDSYNIPENLQTFGFAVSEVKIKTQPVFNNRSGII